MLSLSASEEASEWIESRITARGVSWKKVAKLASRHLVTPALHTALRKVGTDLTIPEDFRTYLECVHSLNSERNQSIVAESVYVTEILNSYGICPVFLKGVGNLLSGLYPSDGDRVIGDIDLLVAQRDFEKTLSVLTEAGFRSVPTLKSEADPLWRPLPQHHAPGLIRPQGACAVEVHRRLWRSLDLRGLDPEGVISQSQPVDTLRCRARRPADWQRVLHNIVHCQIAHRHFEHASTLLRELWEYTSMVQQFSDVDLKKVELLFQDSDYSMAYVTYLDWVEKIFSVASSVRSIRIPRRYRIRQEVRSRSQLYSSAENLVVFLLQAFRNFGRRVRCNNLGWPHLPRFVWVRLGSKQWRETYYKSLVSSLHRH